MLRELVLSINLVKKTKHTFSLLNLPRLSPLLVVSDVEAFCLLHAPPHIPVALLEFTL